MATSASMSHIRHAPNARTRRSSRGRPFREAPLAPAARFGSRGSSGTRCPRPSSEVELRTELCAPVPITMVQDASADLVHSCAIGFVCDLIDDAVDDFTDDLIHDIDDVYDSAPSPAVTPMKLKLPLNAAQLVLSAGEPSILEEFEEDDDICEAALCFTARVAEEALCAVAPTSPSWSLEVNGASNADVSLDNVAKKLELSPAQDEDSDTSSCDGYEEVYSLASEAPDEEDDEDIETMAYVQMAVTLAKAAVAKGCGQFVGEAEPTPEEIMFEQMWYYDEQESPRTEKQQKHYVPRLQAQFASGFSTVDIAKPQQEGSLDFEEAKAAARNALCAALLGRPSLKAVEAEAPEDVEFLGEDSACNDQLSFDFASGILDGAFGQAVDTWAEQEEDEAQSEAEELEELRLQTMATLSKAMHDGKLEAAFRKVSEERELEDLKARAKETLLKAAAQRQLTSQTDQLEELKAKAKDALVKAAREGQLSSALKASSEAAEMNALKLKVRSTLCKAAKEGRLTSTLQEVAPKEPDLETAKEKVRSALAQGLQTGQLGKIFTHLKKSETEAIQQKVRNTFVQGALSGKLSSVIEDILAARKEEAAKASPPQPATPLASPVRETQSRPKQEAVVREAPATPTRTRRRIIGGVVRAPAIDLDLDFPSASPTSDSSTRKRHSKSGRKSLKEAVRPSVIDLDEAGEDSQFSAPKLMLQHPKIEAFNCRSTTVFEHSSSSKASARLRAASTSAMSMDLGLGEAASSSHSMGSSSSLFREAFKPSALSLEPTMRVSASLGALPTHKVSKGGLLPTLNTGKMSVESIAWSMQMSRTASRWSNTGLGRSASMVF